MFQYTETISGSKNRPWQTLPNVVLCILCQFCYRLLILASTSEQCYFQPKFTCDGYSIIVMILQSVDHVPTFSSPIVLLDFQNSFKYNTFYQTSLIFYIDYMNEWMKQLLIQNTPEQLQAKHVTKPFIWIKNNSTIVLLTLKLRYSLMNYSLKLKMSWSLSKRKQFYSKKPKYHFCHSSIDLKCLCKPYEAFYFALNLSHWAINHFP